MLYHTTIENKLPDMTPPDTVTDAAGYRLGRMGRIFAESGFANPIKGGGGRRVRLAASAPLGIMDQGSLEDGLQALLRLRRASCQPLFTPLQRSLTPMYFIYRYADGKYVGLYDVGDPPAHWTSSLDDRMRFESVESAQSFIDSEMPKSTPEEIGIVTY